MFFFSPDLASVTSFNVEENDFLVIATDGLWDNLPDATILEEIKKIKVSSFKHELLYPMIFVV
jgi:serine/threonine protein phosphatase PrpC